MSRQSPHFKVHVTLARHPKTVGLFLDDALLATYVRVGVAAIVHFADRTEDHFVIGGRELCEITRCEQVSGAVQRMRRLAESSPVIFLDPRSAPDQAQIPPSCRPVQSQIRLSSPRTWVLGLPNFARKQGFKSRNGKERGPSASASASASASKNKNKKRPPPSASERSLKVAEALKEKILGVAPGAYVPRSPAALKRWGRALDLFERTDGVTWEAIDTALAWLYGPNLETDHAFVVQSPKALREKWGRIQAQLRKSSYGRDAALVAKYPALLGKP